jgi:hypothetical protein
MSIAIASFRRCAAISSSREDSVGTALDSTNNCSSSISADGPLSPFYSLNYSFGMLLGVADFETEQSYHRGKMRLHNAWLHREGVAWGYGVSIVTEVDELKVSSGLAIDALGRELFLDRDSCVNVPAWYGVHSAEVAADENKDRIKFDAHIVIRFKSCLTGQVPSLSQPCEGTGSATTYSRVFETVDVFLRPGLWKPVPKPYHRLRLMFGLDQPTVDTTTGNVTPDDQVVLSAPRNLDSFRRFAALDEIDLSPIVDDGDIVVPLANLPAIELKKDATGKLSLTSTPIDVSIRPSHVATSTIQELVNGVPEGFSGGPVVTSASVATTWDQITLTLSDKLAEKSVAPAAISFTVFDSAGGWSSPPLTPADLAYDNDTQTITVKIAPPAAGSLIRLLVNGSGPNPVLGANLASFGNGIDFVFSQKR